MTIFSRYSKLIDFTVVIFLTVQYGYIYFQSKHPLKNFFNRCFFGDVK